MKQIQNWSYQEDQCLKRLAEVENNSINWIYVAQELNKIFSYNIKKPYQCQQRFNNFIVHMDDHHSANDWTIEQTDFLFKLFETWGSKWTKIAQLMTGKTQNCVKNRFYGSLRKALRKMNRAAKNLVKKFKKQLKYQSITRIIDASEGLYRLHSPLKEQSHELSRKILSLARRSEQQMPCQQAEELILQINKFNMATRSYKSKKKIKNHSTCSKKQNSLELLSQSQNLNSTFNNFKSIKTTGEIESENYGHSTDEENQDFTEAFLSKSGTTADFSNKEQGRLQQIQLQDQNHRSGRRSTESIQDFFTQVHSPLECQLWI